MPRTISQDTINEAVHQLETAARTMEAFAKVYKRDKDRKSDADLAWLQDKAGACRAAAENLAGDHDENDGEDCGDGCGCPSPEDGPGQPDVANVAAVESEGEAMEPVAAEASVGDPSSVVGDASPGQGTTETSR
jgi:hypothetical protein